MDTIYLFAWCVHQWFVKYRKLRMRTQQHQLHDKYVRTWYPLTVNIITQEILRPNKKETHTKKYINRHTKQTAINKKKHREMKRLCTLPVSSRISWRKKYQNHFHCSHAVVSILFRFPLIYYLRITFMQTYLSFSSSLLLFFSQSICKYAQLNRHFACEYVQRQLVFNLVSLLLLLPMAQWNSKVHSKSPNQNKKEIKWNTYVIHTFPHWNSQW